MRVAIGELGIKHIYAFYVDKTPNPLTFVQFKKVTSQYLAGVMDLIVEESHNFRIPSFLGYFRIQKRKLNYGNLSIDWQQTRKLGMTIYHLNDHSDNFRIRLLWEKKKAILKAGRKLPYSFTLSRYWKRKLASNMKSPNGHTRYPEEIINNKSHEVSTD